MSVAPLPVRRPSAHDGSSLEAGAAPGRILFVNDRQATSACMTRYGLKYPDNRVRTSKYSIVTFLPKNLFEQFRRVANFYFLVISLLQLTTKLSPTNPYSTVGPLMLVLIATMIKEAIEDKARHEADRQVNHEHTAIYDSATASWKSITWMGLHVGDLIKVSNNQPFPADLVLLASSAEDGQAQVETASLDGESNLKMRFCPTAKHGPLEPTAFPSKMVGEIRCEAPNRRLYTFDGVLRLKGSEIEESDISLTIDNVVLRGMKLCNTEYIVGVVVAAGPDSKLMLNTKATPSKFSRLDVIANRCILLVFSVLFVVCCISTGLSLMWTHQRMQLNSTSYLSLLISSDILDVNNFASTFVTYLILYNNLVPISLYISLEVVKWYQAKKMENDPEMIDPQTGRAVLARTSNLNEDVGQIKYLFSDKTGTITKNEMVLKVISIDNVIYDSIPGPLRKRSMMATTDMSFAKRPSQPNAVVMLARETSMRRKEKEYAERVASRLRMFQAEVQHYDSLASIGSNPTSETAKQPSSVTVGDTPLSKGNLAQYFFRCLLLCHTATIAPDDEIRASSPDEAALLRAAIEFNCRCRQRTVGAVTINIFGDDESYDILALNEFDSTRKCMSIIVRNQGDGDIWMFCKGADTAMMACAGPPGSKTSGMALHIHYFASMGLRTLVFGYKRLTVDEYTSWFETFTKAKTSLVDREIKLIDCARSMETDVTLLGATGVEDQLQDGVTHCIQTLSAAGINIWMLTGDKDETAISIANSCGLLADQSHLVVVNEKTKPACLYQIANARKKLRKAGLWHPGRPSHDIALVINGEALECLLAEDDAPEPAPIPDRYASCDALGSPESGRAANESSAEGPGETRDKDSARQIRASLTFDDPSELSVMSDGGDSIFMQLVTQCCSVIACRLSPLQKAQIVALIKTSKGRPVTMAVGDGGNDVSMIQESHIGADASVGMQAVRSADFAIGQFRFLSRLILAHGRWNYRRVSIVILFSFYKNMALIMTLFCYSFYNGYSGQTMYESYLIVGWNVLYTLFPILVLGVIDEDISSETVLRYPFIFRNNQKGQELNIDKMRVWVVNALLHSFLVYILGTYFVYIVDGWSLPDSSVFLYGTAMYGVLVMTVTMKAAMVMQRMHRWTRWHYLSIVSGPLIYFIFVLLYSQAYVWIHISPFSDFCGLSRTVFGSAPFWLVICPVSFASLSVDLIVMYLQRMYLPTNQDIIEEIDCCLDTSETPKLRDSSSKTWIMANNPLGDWIKQDASTTEHEELCRHLVRMEKAIAREIGAHRNEDQDKVVSTTVQPAIHPITLEFMGEENAELEHEYNINFVTREARRIRTLLAVVIIAIPPYSFVEYLGEGDKNLWPYRVAMFVCAVASFMYTRTRFFLRHYQYSVVISLLIAGIVFTQAIKYTGKFAVTIFTIILYSVVRVKFVYATWLAFFNFFYFLVSGYLGLNHIAASSENSSIDDTLFVLFMFILIGMAAYGGYNLQATMRRDFLQNRILMYQERRSTEILNNMLPEHVVKRMQIGDTLISEEEKDVTLLFCDIADFGYLFKRYSPVQMVSLLDRIYSLFDQLCLKHGLRKMETVGKTYFCCAGLQDSEKGREAALRTAAMAHEMMAVIAKCKASNGNGIRIRIGVHSGRVISGLVGMKKQQFSLFGDTVNTASRMQSTGITGHIQLSQMTFDKIHSDFHFEERTVEAKGKGQMKTFLLGRPTTALAERACRGHWDAGKHVESRRVSVPSSKENIESKQWLLTLVQRFLDAFQRALEFRQNESLAAKELEMKAQIDLRWLHFKDTEFENAYLQAVVAQHNAGTRRTLLALAVYLVYAILRDILHDAFVNACPSCYSYMFVFGALRLVMFLFIVWYEYSLYHAAKRRASTVVPLGVLRSTNRHNHRLLVFFIITSIVLFMPNLLRWIDEQVSILYSYLCLDIIIVMFLASFGGSLQYQTVLFVNGFFISGSAIIFIVLQQHFESATISDSEKLRIYPLAITLFIGLSNVMARRDNEFFGRRKYWLQTCTQLETKKADQMLYKMLPQSLVTQLKDGDTVCDQHHHVGILFSDIKGFTSIAARADTDKVVHILDSLFTAFDKLTEKHGVFKVQTIGDAYVIVSGLPYADVSLSTVSVQDLRKQVLHQSVRDGPPEESSNRTTRTSNPTAAPSTHLRNLIRMASDMQEEVQKVMDPNSGDPLQMRIGIHLGSIIAGVIGTSTLRYDMWGPDVLTANEMETNGVPGRILVSQDVQREASVCPDLAFQFHKNIDFTNANLDTFLVDLVPSTPPTPPPTGSTKSTNL
ncbi:phospholipid-transporting ATPase [Achlya hypogyna]|uniref:P-type phospholipid transporter n=1 Tax=Achlya hypogyna TaxID=1202772 RepID=A0A1V9ZUF1_ACHHY|nr:phospholipid-transporting ATPase [Achlya hypogyna]